MKYNIEEVEMALNYVKKNSNAVEIDLEIDTFNHNHLLIKIKDKYENHVEIAIYESASAMMPTVTETVRLTRSK